MFINFCQIWADQKYIDHENPSMHKMPLTLNSGSSVVIMDNHQSLSRFSNGNLVGAYSLDLRWTLLHNTGYYVQSNKF